jgi:hypothetical protein
VTRTDNPQAAAEQARKSYRDVTTKLGRLGLNTAIPESVRDLAEKTLAHTRETHDRSADAFEASVATFENSGFDLVKSLAGAKNLADMAELQAAYWRKQFGILANQAEEVRALSIKVTADAAAPIKDQMARGADGTAH